MKNLSMIVMLLMLGIAIPSHAQLGLGKKKAAKDSTETTKEDKDEKKGNSGAGKFFNKVITKVAKIGGTMMTSTTSDLSAVVPNVYYMNHLHPKDVGSVDQAFFNGWKEGGSMVGIMLTSKGSFGMNKVDGQVLVDGKPAEYVSTGLYVYFAEDDKPRRVEISTSKNKSSFTLNAPKQKINVVSVNGMTDNISLDLSKDVVLELDNLGADTKTPILVSIAVNALGLKTFYQVGYFDPASKIVITPAHFRNINMSPGTGDGIMNYRGCFLKVERGSIDQATELSGVYDKIEYGNIYYDGKFVSITKEPTLNRGLTTKGADKYANGTVSYEVYKPNAFISRAFDQMKTVGVSAFAIRGTTYTYEQKDNKLEGTRTTKEASFPQLPDAVWDGILSELYEGIIPIIQSEFNVSVVPLEKVTSTEAYKSISAYSKDDVNNEVEFSRAYKDTKVISVFIPISEAYGINNVDTRLMNESGTNVLLKVTLDLRINFDKSKPAMIPILGLELMGEQNGPTQATKYLTATVTGEGMPYSKKTVFTREVLEERVIRKTDLLTTLKKALQEMKAKEAANGDYNTIWSKKK